MSIGPAWTWAVPLVVAVIALCGVTVTVVVQWSNFNRQLRATHVLKISEMRQNWINNLRDAMASFQSYGVTPELDQNAKREFFEAGTRIELLMNPADPDYEELHNRMYVFLSAETVLDKFSANPGFVAVCQRILKREWEVLKAEVRATGRNR
jgi:hypothetical protein